MRKRIHVYYSGNVQGIGFRFVTHDLTCKLKLGGWVKNLEDGRVELVAEGQEKFLKEMLEKIKINFGDNIQDSQIEWQKATDEFQDFTIEF